MTRLTRRLPAAWLAALWMIAAFPLSAAEAGHAQPSILWKWVNFAIFAAGLGYLIVKKGGPALRARGEEIRRSMHAASELRADAEAEAAAIERKLAGLGEEVASLRQSLTRDMEAERRRIETETAAMLAKIERNAESEIERLSRQAESELRSRAAELALELARERVRGRLTPDADRLLVREFAAGILRPAGGAK